MLSKVSFQGKKYQVGCHQTTQEGIAPQIYPNQNSTSIGYFLKMSKELNGDYKGYNGVFFYCGLLSQVSHIFMSQALFL